MHRMLQVPGHMLRGEREVLVPNRNFLGATWKGVYIIPQFESCCATCCGWCGQKLDEVQPTVTINTEKDKPPTASSMQPPP
jgi:hypothetical protein